MKVDFPDPLAPISPYLFPLENVMEISSKRGFEPYCIAILLVVIKKVLFTLMNGEIHYKTPFGSFIQFRIKNPIKKDRVFL
jgi:hypothetical protein